MRAELHSNDNMMKRKNRQKLLQKSRRFTDKDFVRRWCRFKVVPYMDLALARDLDSADITDQDIAEVLFGFHNKEDVTTLRNSTIPYATELLHPDPLNKLITQAGFDVRRAMKKTSSTGLQEK
jgi:hypothetical protein